MRSATPPRKRYERLIESAEIEIQKHPKRYKLKVTLLAILGYAFIFGILITSIIIFGALSWAALANTTLLLLLIKTKIIFGLLVLDYVLIRALWINFEQPSGYNLDKKKYPILFAELTRLRQKVKTPAIHQVILIPEYNAAILQRPRLGILGWQKNTLCLGLELLMGMSPQQASSVISHELGHLSGKDGLFSRWIYRIRIRWQNIMMGVAQQRNMGAAIMRKFFCWYAPTFSAYSFALARANEYHADHIAAKLTSTEDVANALANSHVIPGLLEQNFWRPFFKRADQEPAPPSSPYSQLWSFFQNTLFEHTTIETQIEKAMAIRTGHFDTHPALKDRLEALNCQIKRPEPINNSAAQLWFGELLPFIINHFDQQWIELNISKWSERYQYFQHGCMKLAELKKKDIESISSPELWQLASLAEEFGEARESLELFKLYKSREPMDFNVDFVIGRLLLIKNDEAGVDILMEVMKQRQYMALPVCESLAYFYWGRNDQMAANYWREEAETQRDLLFEAQEERKTISSSDKFIAPDTSSEAYFQLVEQTKLLKGVIHIWLAEKKVSFLPGWKTYVLAFENGTSNGESIAVQTIESQLKINSICFVIMRDGGLVGIAEKVIKMGIKIF
jgi:Zn-dependent protease with chaperone function